MTLSRDPGVLLEEARGGSRVALARLLSMVERGGPVAADVAALVYTAEAPYTVGLTGAPGAGKSTLTDQLISAARGGWSGSGPAEPVDEVAVLAIDPSSPFTGGAILGDRVRMQAHATDPSVFIRSMATRGHLGGLALAVPDALRVIGAAGLPLVLVETVGVGQMEVEVAGATDTTVVVVNPGWGDAMQANKAGLLEIADLFVINKADRPGVAEARRDLEQMLELSAPKQWRPPIVETTAATGAGVDELWAAISDHRRHLLDHRLLEAARATQLERVLRQAVVATVETSVIELAGSARYRAMLDRVVAGELDPYRAARELLG